MNERLRELRQALNLTQRDFCSIIGMSQSTYASMETGAREIKDAYLKLICRSFQVNEVWLKHGNGKMFLEAPNKELEELLHIFDKLTPALQNYLLKQARDLLNLQESKKL